MLFNYTIANAGGKIFWICYRGGFSSGCCCCINWLASYGIKNGGLGVTSPINSKKLREIASAMVKRNSYLLLNLQPSVLLRVLQSQICAGRQLLGIHC